MPFTTRELETRELAHFPTPRAPRKWSHEVADRRFWYGPCNHPVSLGFFSPRQWPQSRFSRMPQGIAGFVEIFPGAVGY